ncbi:MAG: exodeoxyribonuclease VII small subunit, partial [Lachnospiraceae bacterium]|nr:exodeoxyribonuclease VII small subunit [Lachnospiraceae bacterium]
LEEIMAELGEIVSHLENDNMSLEESYQYFSKGMKLVMEGNQSIDKVEKEMKVLTKGENDEL